MKDISVDKSHRLVKVAGLTAVCLYGTIAMHIKRTAIWKRVLLVVAHTFTGQKTSTISYG